MDKEFYVYEWFNKDSGYIFYVGKGKNNRCKNVGKTKRNSYFVRYYNKYDCDYRIIQNNLTEEESLKLEHKTIVKYRKLGYCCCNFDDGGRNGGSCIGDKNGMFGKTHTKEARDKIRATNSDGRFKGENNPQYKISPRDRMSREVYEKWTEKQKARKFGETNPNYGNKTLHIKYKEDKELSKEKQSRPGVQNGMSKEIMLYDINMNLIGKFDYIEKCIDYLIENKLVKTNNRNSIRCGMLNSNKDNRPYLKHYFKY